ncbi:MAG: hypothetical protein R6W70_04890 [bacterium]
MSLKETKKYKINSNTKKYFEKYLKTSSLDMHSYVITAIQLTPEKHISNSSKTPHDDSIILFSPGILSEKSMKDVEKISVHLGISVDEYVRRCVEFQLSDPYDKYGNVKIDHNS